MERERELVAIFGKCSRLINKIALETGDDFLARLYLENSDFLTSEFIIFLRSSGIVSCKNNVAQYIGYFKLSARVRAVINLIKISEHFDFTGVPTPLLLERELLVFQSAVLDFFAKNQERLEPKGAARTGDVKEASGVNKFLKPKLKPKVAENQKTTEAESFDETAERILEVVKKQPGLTLKEVNNLVADLNRRTIERKLNDLIKLGFVWRDKRDGKKILMPR